MMQLDIDFIMEEKHMKKWIALVLTVVLITTLTACSHAENTETIAYHDMVFSKSDLSEEVCQWLEWYNDLTKAEQLSVSYIPSELYQLHGDFPEENAKTEETTKKSDIKNTFTGNLETYYELSDGTWQCSGLSYKYRLEITGTMPNAAAASTFVYLSNLEHISFEQAYLAAGLSSNTEDYFSPDEAVLVEWITQ